MLKASQVSKCRRLCGSYTSGPPTYQISHKLEQLSLKEHDEKQFYLARQHLLDLRNMYAVLTDLIHKNITKASFIGLYALVIEQSPSSRSAHQKQIIAWDYTRFNALHPVPKAKHRVLLLDRDCFKDIEPVQCRTNNGSRDLRMPVYLFDVPLALMDE